MSSYSFELAKEVEKSKKDKRLESKKRKAIALLKLIEMKSLETDTSVSPAKKASLQKSVRNSLQEDASVSDCCLEKMSRKSQMIKEDYKREKERFRQQQKAAMERPKIFLTLDELIPFQNMAEDIVEDLRNQEKIPPLFIMDLQQLLLFALLKNNYKPRWCRLLRPNKVSSVVLVVLHDVSITDFEEHPDCFQYLKKDFPMMVEMVSPTQYGSTVDHDLYSVPMSISQIKKYVHIPEFKKRVVNLLTTPKNSGNSESNVYIHDEKAGVKCESEPLNIPEFKKRVVNLITTPKNSGNSESNVNVHDEKAGVKCESEPLSENISANDSRLMKENKPCGVKQGQEELVSRTSLLLSTTQMMAEGYPVPVVTKNDVFSGYVFSKDTYKPVSSRSPLFAVDCEMCLTSAKENELTRVSIVNEEKIVIYDSLVKPFNPVVNYLTKWSGITREILEPVTKRLNDVQSDIIALLPQDAILCGQSLWNDLRALKLFHPYVIDTSVIYNMSGSRGVKAGLRRLAYHFLGRTIQNSESGHCSTEDAIATMDLVQLKLSKGLEFGDAILGGVYFPDMRTYFLGPGPSQNVQEKFAHSKEGNSSILSFTEVKDNECIQKSGCSEERTVGKYLKKTFHKLKNTEVNQQQVFFQQRGNSIILSIFQLIADSNLSACIIGRSDEISKYESEQHLHRIAVTTDKAAYHAVSEGKDLIWVNFTAFSHKLSSGSGQDKIDPLSSRDIQEKDDKKKVFGKLDRLVKKLVKKLSEKTLVAVVMTGRNTGTEHLNAASFVRVI